ncbi:hypothetical protein T05_2457 [Trichinella murrelli]|uniref:Uncharacterized protein n=1 Tax=Trichinella murrelli TaxID=144512 RepID=A0A0V0U9R5_9BILA|nr:hypothetical protein T05_2457 [Trichinella murrelli]
MHRKQVGRKKLPFSKMGRSPEQFENHWLIALNGWFIALTLSNQQFFLGVSKLIHWASMEYTFL